MLQEIKGFQIIERELDLRIPEVHLAECLCRMSDALILPLRSTERAEKRQDRKKRRKLP